MLPIRFAKLQQGLLSPRRCQATALVHHSPRLATWQFQSEGQLWLDQRQPQLGQNLPVRVFSLQLISGRLQSVSFLFTNKTV